MDDPEYVKGAWLLGRSTYFDAPMDWKQKFSSQTTFGDLHGNGCGYVNKGEGEESIADLPYPIDAVAAVADFDPRFHEAACGSCYEVKCVSGPILWDYEQTWMRYRADPPGFYETDPDARDTMGRKVPGRNAARGGADRRGGGGGGLFSTGAVTVTPAEGVVVEEWEYTRCWDDDASVFVRVIDLCPCEYSWGRQRVCCGPIPHFDLSYWAHEKLAHPIQGKMMLQFRPVDCNTKAPLDARKGAAARLGVRDVAARDGVLVNGGGSDQKIAKFSASSSSSSRGGNGNVNGGVKGGRTIVLYREGPAPGWGWNAYNDQWVILIRPGYGASGSNGGCFSVSPGGRLSLMCLECERSLRPFAGAKTIRLWIRAGCAAAVDDEPPVYLAVSTRYSYDYVLGRAPDEVHCGDKVNVWRFVADKKMPGGADKTNNTTPDDNCGRVVDVPMSAFRGCTMGRASRANSLSIELGHAVGRDREICFDEVSIST